MSEVDGDPVTGDGRGVGLQPGCSRCAEPLVAGAPDFVCAQHGTVAPVWRPEEPSYDDFGRHLHAASGLPTYLPWPLGTGWRVSDFAVVTMPGGRPLATLAACTGTTDLDGPIDVIVVSEEAGTGLGARCAGLAGADPRLETGPAAARVRVAGRAVPLWSVSTAEAAPRHEERSVLVGEASGRWLWLLLQPASALLLLHEEWHLHDVSQMGPTLVDLVFDGPAPRW